MGVVGQFHLHASWTQRLVVEEWDPMSKRTPATKKDFGRDMKAFDKLPAKTKELMILKDSAEKAIGPEKTALHDEIRDKSKAPRTE